MTYLDFELEISAGAGREFPVRVVHSPAGEARETMLFPFDTLALENRLKDLQIALLRSGGKTRKMPLPEEQAVQDFGRALFEALFIGEVRTRYDMSWREATHKDLGLRLKLRIQSPALAALPWEFLYDSRQAEYVCLSRNTPIVRYLEIPQPIQRLTVAPPLRILGMAVSPHDEHLGKLDVAREKQRVENATKDLRERGVLELKWLEGQTWRDLHKAMRSGSWHIFHFIGHGGFDKHRDEGLIYLSNEDGDSERLLATDLSRMLADHRSLRLVLLNACEGARGSDRDLFSSTAAILVRRGLPAVLAMQYAITDNAAIEFSRAFYDVLAEGLAVDTAVVEARKAVSFAVTNTIEWGTPVLYMRAPDGKIFDLDRPQPLPKKAAPPPWPVDEKKKPVATPRPTAQTPQPASRVWPVFGIVLTLTVIAWLVYQYGDWSGPAKQTPSQIQSRLSPSDSLYLKLVADGDDLFNRNEFAKAKQKYQQALAQKPGDANAAAKLKACDEKLNEAGRDKLYTQYRDEGDALYQQKKYAEARDKYEAALQKKPGDGYATARKQACEERLTEQRTSFETYKANGDRLFKQGQYLRAKDQYEQALSVRENDSYVAKQIRECDRLQAAQTAKRAQPQETPTTSAPTGMVLIPAGSFTMGSNDGESDEKPPHQVSVEAFYMDKYEVTVAQYQKFLAANPAHQQPTNWTEQLQNTTRPVVYVSWNDAVAYCNWLSQQRGKRVRLPTEAEWEYAARGGLSNKKYPWGDEISPSQANYNNPWGSEWSKGAGKYLREVGSYNANNHGLFDMAGNVWEWCSSLFKYYPYNRSDGRESLSSFKTYVFRGGSWNNNQGSLRCAIRYDFGPRYRDDNVGFRCVQDVR